MNDVAKFWKLKSILDEAEKTKSEAQKILNENYSDLIAICPHSEAIDWSYSNGVYRVCMICGIEDHSSEGGSPGDEYNYGTNGHPSRSFWKNSTIYKAASEEEHWKYRERGHDFRVKNGKAWTFGA